MSNQILMAFVTLIIFSFSLSTVALAEKKSKGKGAATKTSASKSAPSQKPKTVNPSASSDGYSEVSSTRIDFTDTAIDGKMKTPEGFMLQGHQSSSMSDMVKLRSHFRNELDNSKSATKAIVK